MIKRTLFFTNPAYLSVSNEQLVVKVVDEKSSKEGDAQINEEQQKTIPIEDIGFVIIDNPRITVTSGVFSALLENNAAVITCNNKHLPTGMMLSLDGNSIQNERFREQLDASIPLRKQLWQQTVSMKIKNQAKVLHNHTDEETGCMNVWSRSVRSGDPENLEARAAAYYWRYLFNEISGFNRDREGVFPNNLLNYGYAILRSVIARALVGSGLLPTIGIHHHNRYNSYCLADDIMEPYRPFVDELVIQIMEEFPGETELTKNVKARLLTIPTLDVTIKGKRSPLMIAASMTTASLAKCYEGVLRQIEYPEM